MLCLNKLAKSSKWQAIFALNKDFNGIGLFKNTVDFSSIQLEFLGWLSFYYNAQMSIHMGEMPQFAYDKDIYIEAFNMYSNKERIKKHKEYKNLDFTNKQSEDNKIKQGLKILFE